MKNDDIIVSREMARGLGINHAGGGRAFGVVVGYDDSSGSSNTATGGAVRSSMRM